MKTYVTRRLTVDAVQYTGDNAREIAAFAGSDKVRVTGNGELEVLLTEGWVTVRDGWWVHKDTVTGSIGLCSGKAFEQVFREPTARDMYAAE